MPSKNQKELRKHVDQVLLEFWDPLRVADNPDAQNEYSSYAKKIVEMLNNDRDSYRVADYLRQAESGWLGSANEMRLQKVVSLLFSLDDERT